MGLTMKSALPDGLENQQENADVAVTTDIIRISFLNMLENMTRDTAPSQLPKEHSANSTASWLWFTMASLGHSIREDEYDRPIHPIIADFVTDSTASYESLDHMDEMGH